MKLDKDEKIVLAVGIALFIICVTYLIWAVSVMTKF